MPHRLILRPRSKLWAYKPYLIALGTVLALWTAIAVKYANDRASDLTGVTRNLENLSQIFEENILRSIGEVDKTLFYLRRNIEQNMDSVDYRKLVARNDILSDIIVQVAVIDASGIMRATSADPQAKELDLSDRQHYRVHRGASEDFLYMSAPVIGRASNRWSVQFTRRLRDRSGKFAGVVVASLDPAHFTELYSSMKFDGTGAIVLVGLDGIVRAAGGRTEISLGQDLNAAPFMAEMKSNRAGTIRIEWSDGVHEGAYRQVKGRPLAVLVSVPTADVLRGARQDLFWLCAGGAVLTLLISVAGEWGSRYQRRLRIAQLRLVRSQRRELRKSRLLATTLENVTHGIMLVNKDMHVLVINRRTLELLDLPESWLSSPPPFKAIVDHLVATGDVAELSSGGLPDDWALPRHEDGTFKNYERARPNGTVLEVRTTPVSDGGFVRTITDITPRRAAQEAIARLASQDPLTHLANRRQFQLELDQAALGLVEAGEGFALMSLDLDHFKKVNDTLGHPIGDELLMAAAERIRLAMRANDTVYRLGGDEFAVILRPARTQDEVGAVAQRLAQSLGSHFMIKGHRIDISTSIGICFAPRDGTQPEQLLTAADTALYAAKTTGRNTFTFFEPHMLEKIRLEREIDADLRLAMERNHELKLHYQPIINLADSAIVGFEALLRWDHPHKGSIPPAAFIPVAEASGLIVELGRWALREACHEAQSWPSYLMVAVNVSSAQFKNNELIDTVKQCLSESRLAPHRLELEITETILMADNEPTAIKLDTLRELGVKLAMDDFGTGFSSLSYLRSFPLNKIKIDRSFVSELRAGSSKAVIVRSIIDIARSLDMTVTAEGVETSDQLLALQMLRCDQAQGFLISEPLSASEIVAFLAPQPRALAQTA